MSKSTAKAVLHYGAVLVLGAVLFVGATRVAAVVDSYTTKTDLSFYWFGTSTTVADPATPGQKLNRAGVLEKLIEEYQAREAKQQQ